MISSHRTDDATFQFSLRGLLQLVTLLAVYCAMVRSVGLFLAALAIGVLVVATAVIILRVENLLQGSITGVVVSSLFLALAAAAFPPTEEWLLIGGWLAYPPLGYCVGGLCAVDHGLRSG
jgi:hypothetical protein